ncbi:RNA polymerase sigma factor [Pseudoxanthomonas daejeonensis]|uniref:RNA polymerase subunit sigma-24 n=1 Tax=Pseudoxanthomonas daejeonensis TaxID=266062 RepID=A0ABQ6Z5L6_9GAMM|nr:sigma-70 family RNA polymerase sigma factor [Pseudoxanthomonas daejeonensis]KAF1693775.1 RNA polymerase subunit sigma-24 [Pseudoxanthomonas daejeonensis]
MDEHDRDDDSGADRLRRARRGDEAAFESIYREHARAIHALALRLTGSPAAAEDITQDTFLRMFGFLSGLREDTPLRPWLKRVAANLAIDRLRRERRYSDDDALLQALDGNAAPATVAEASGLLRRLPPLARTLVWLHEMEGWSHEELARRFGRSPSWSKSILSRSLARLREHLEPAEDDDEHA